MMQYQPFSPVDIRFTSMPVLLEQLSCMADKRVMIMASQGTLKRLEAYEDFGRFTKQKKNRIFSDIRPNPSVDDVLGFLKLHRSADKYDCILAIGGGSCIDLAKAIAALQGLANTHGLDYEGILEAIAHKSFFQGYEPPGIIAVPTTAGTGSEVTKWATIWDFKYRKKLSVEHPGCFPKYAFMIPELTKSMPPRLTLSTGLDALSHAMEAFWARKRNPLSQALALHAVECIKCALPSALDGADDPEARKEMCLGSLLAGLAFSMTKTTACHSISYPLTLNHGVEHGFAAAITLSAMIKINAEAVPELTEIIRLFGSAEGFDTWLNGVTRGIQELRLSAFGIFDHMIDGIAQEAFTLGRMDNNPFPMERESVIKILKNLL